MFELVVEQLGVDRNEGQRRWRRLESRAQSLLVQQTLDWQHMVTQVYGDRPVFLIARADGEDVGGLPLYRFEQESGVVYNSSPGAGPLGGVLTVSGISQELRVEVYRRLLNSACAIASADNALALSIITHPMLSDAQLYNDIFAPDFVFENFTQVTRVKEAVAGGVFILPNNKQRNPGRTIKKARRAGVLACLAETDATIEKWLAIHEKRHAELGVPALSRDFLSRTLTELRDPNGAFLMVSEVDGKLCGGCLFVYTPYCCDAFMLSMDSAYASLSPNYVVMEAAFIEMERRNIEFFNWQSSPSRNSGVYQFKSQWGCKEVSYSFVTRTFAGLNALLDLGERTLKEQFPGHFVVPYGLFDDPERRRFAKE